MAGRIRDKLLSWKILTFFWNEDRIVFLYFYKRIFMVLISISFRYFILLSFIK